MQARPKAPSTSIPRLIGAAVLMLGAIAVLHYACLSVYPKKELDVYKISDFYPLQRLQLPHA